MNLGFNDDISPWDEDHRKNIFTLQYQQPATHRTKKFSESIDYIRSHSKKKTKKSNRKKILLNNTKNYNSVKSHIFGNPASKLSQNELMIFKTEKLKIQSSKSKSLSGVKSQIFQTNSKEEKPDRNSNFIIKKYPRMKKFDSFLVKDEKIDDIFKKMQEIQNPTHRQNINLPRIYLKM